MNKEYLQYVRRELTKGLYLDSSQEAVLVDLDLSEIIGLPFPDFIMKLYQMALQRDCSEIDIVSYENLMNRGATREALIYNVCTGHEFGKRANVVSMQSYEEAFHEFKKFEASGQKANISLEYILSMRSDKAIIELYKKMLARIPCAAEVNNYLTTVRNGLTIHCIIYLISISEEFNNRFNIQHIETYKKIYIKTRLKQKIMKVPLLGRVIGLLILPKKIELLLSRLEQLEVNLESSFNEINRRQENIEYNLHKHEERANWHKENIINIINENKANIEQNFKPIYNVKACYKARKHKLVKISRGML